MASALDPPKLYVEGKNDFHTLIHLLKRNGIDYDTKPWHSSYPKLEEKQNIEGLLEAIEVTIAASTGKPVGFVADADVNLQARWDAVRDRLDRAGVKTPKRPPKTGFLGESERYKCPVGVWLMPDNASPGILEDFLKRLVAEQDPLIGHAEASTIEARTLGATFAEVKIPKAKLLCWLAWQDQPGLSYGVAMSAGYFLHDTPLALAFVNWFRTLYAIPTL